MDQMEQNCKISKILYSDTIIVLLMPANFALTDRINTTILDSSDRVIINMRVLAIAAILILASSSEARRRPGNGGRPQKQRQPKGSANYSFVGKWILLKIILEDPGTIIRCMAENFGQDDKIQVTLWLVNSQYVWVLIGVSRNVETASRPLARTWCRRQTFPR